MYRVSRHFASAAVIGLCIIPATAAQAEDEDRNDFVQTNLVSDIPGLATITDRELLNPWGISHSPTSPFWVSNQAANTSTLYSVTDETNVSKVNLTVAIPKTAQGPQGPTGQVSNTNTSSFLAYLRRFEHFKGSKCLILLRWTPKGRHYSGVGGAEVLAVILGGGWAGSSSFSLFSKRLSSGSGSV